MSSKYQEHSAASKRGEYDRGCSFSTAVQTSHRFCSTSPETVMAIQAKKKKPKRPPPKRPPGCKKDKTYVHSFCGEEAPGTQSHIASPLFSRDPGILDLLLTKKTSPATRNRKTWKTIAKVNRSGSLPSLHNSMLASPFGRRLPSGGDWGRLQQPLQGAKKTWLGTLLHCLALLGHQASCLPLLHGRTHMYVPCAESAVRPVRSFLGVLLI